MGDYNACHELWNCVKSNQRGKKLAKLFFNCNWDPYFPINPTRLAKCMSKNDNTIDFLITNNKTKCVNISTISTPTGFNSDHEPILCNIRWPSALKTNIKKSKFWNFKRTNFTKFAHKFLYFYFKSENPHLMFIELYKCIQNNAHLNIKQKISNGVSHIYGNRKLNI